MRQLARLTGVIPRASAHADAEPERVRATDAGGTGIRRSHSFYAKASIGGHAHTRLRSP